MFEKNWGKRIALILTLFWAFFPAQALAMTLTDLGKLDDFSSRAGKNYLYSDLGTGERVCFSLDEAGVLHLLGSKGQDYLSFIPYDTRGAEGLTYQVKKLQLDHFGRQFWQITAFAGIHEMNCGYWLVGKVGKRYMALVSLSNLASLGYTPDSWHSLHSKVEGERLILTSTHEIIGQGDIYHPQNVIDWQGAIYWDKAADWFGIDYLR